MFPNRPLFSQRLVREDDALLCLETLAFLIRRHGPPSRPPVPSPLHKSHGLDMLFYDEDDERSVYDWAQDSYATVADCMQIDPDHFRLVSSVEPVAPTPGLLTFDPRRVGEKGHYVSNLTLDICASRMDGFDPGFVVNGFQPALVVLAAAAYHRAGLALTNVLPAVTEALAEHGVPQRFVENTLVFSACAVLSVLRQSPEQMVATYGPAITTQVRKKIRPACRQVESYGPELKLLQVMGERPKSVPRGCIRADLGVQPQRISWM